MNIFIENIAISTVFLLILINSIGYFYSYLIVNNKIGRNSKIQINSKLDTKYLHKHLPLFILNVIILIILVFIGLFFETFSSYIIDTTHSITFKEICSHLFVILLFDDVFFYVLHRFMHENKYIYSKIHKIHHRANSPIPIDYIYVHPLEWLSGFIGPFIGILFLGGVSIYTFWLYLLVRNFHEISIHSGLKSNFIYKILPFYGENEHHDMHHLKRDGNYSSTFTFMDFLFKTKF